MATFKFGLLFAIAVAIYAVISYLKIPTNFVPTEIDVTVEVDNRPIENLNPVVPLAREQHSSSDIANDAMMDEMIKSILVRLAMFANQFHRVQDM